MTPVTPSEALHALFEAWERRDVDALADLFVEDGAYEDPLRPDTIVGRDRIRDDYRGSLEDLTECRISVRHTFESGDLGVAEGHFGGALKAGGRLDFPFVALVEMHDGKIARIGEYFDTKPLTP
jgi:ketosteroid isomerase-like protein